MRGEQVKFADAEMTWTDFTRRREERERAGWNFASFASSREPWSEVCLATVGRRKFRDLSGVRLRRRPARLRALNRRTKEREQAR